MATVQVIDSAYKRVFIKVKPDTPMYEVRSQAVEKLRPGKKDTTYGFKQVIPSRNLETESLSNSTTPGTMKRP